MTEYTPEKVADLIAEARGFAAGSESARATLMRDLADALEVAVKEADRMESECVEHRARHVEWVAKAEAERDELRAVIAEALDWRDEAYHGAFGKGEFAQGYRYARRAIERILSRIPEHPKED